MKNMDTYNNYIQKVVERFYKMNELDPGWDHYDLQHLYWIFNYYQGGAFEDEIEALYNAKDWSALNNLYYQRNRLDIFPTYVDLNYPHWNFFESLNAVAVGDDKGVEHLFPKNLSLKVHIEMRKGIYPMCRVGEILLGGMWYQDEEILNYIIPKATKFAAGKSPKCDVAAIAYMLALQEHDVSKASEYLNDACKVLHNDLTPMEKRHYLPAHGLYRLAARILDEDEFQKLSMPEYKTFCREYAEWRNSNTEPPQLYAPFPKPVDFLNDMFMGDWHSIQWKGLEDFPFIGNMPKEWHYDKDGNLI